MRESVPTTVLLDAMGVIYRAGDDVAELLVPFIQARNPDAPVAGIEASYLAASLGQLSAADFWKHSGLDPSVEDEYLNEHRLQDGVLDFCTGRKANHSPFHACPTMSASGPKS